MNRYRVLKGSFAVGALCFAVILASPGICYEVLLDIDLDDDPTTINELTDEPFAVVRMVLAPTELEEQITSVFFGLGGSCLECEQVHHYGTAFDIPLEEDWTEVDELFGSGAWATLAGCADDPGYHLVLEVVPLIDYFVLTEPIFIATFNAWVADPVPPGCEQPASNLAAMFELGDDGYWNYVQIGGPAISADAHSWTFLKGLYR